MGRGDKFTLSTQFSSSISNFEDADRDLLDNYSVTHRIPLNSIDSELELSITSDDSYIENSTFADLGLRSKYQEYGISVRQPLIQAPYQELAVSIGLASQKKQTFLFEDVPFSFGLGADSEGVTQTTILTVGQEYQRLDLRGYWSVQTKLNFGLGILGATTHDDSTPDGQFFSWEFQGQRVHQLGGGNGSIPLWRKY